VDGARTSTGAALAELRKNVGVAAETAVILANTAAVPHPPVARGLDQNHPVVGRRRAACVEPLPLAVLRHLCVNYHEEIHQPENTSRLNTAYASGAVPGFQKRSSSLQDLGTKVPSRDKTSEHTSQTQRIPGFATVPYQN